MRDAAPALDAVQPLPITEIVLREFTVPAPGLLAHHPAVRPDAGSDPVRGWLVGVCDGRQWGWWGPIEERVAAHAPAMLAAAFPTLPASVRPGEFARTLRRATRHAHSGLLAVAVGSLELAVWDLAGKRAGLPVWALLAPRAVRDTVPAYATCFGVSRTPKQVARVMDEVAHDYTVQKWRPHILEAELAGVAAEFVARRGPGRLAVDFAGAWPPDRVRAACRAQAGALAWVEEPYHPDEVDTAAEGEFGAPHASGEHCYGPADAAHLRAGHVDVWQPDAVFCGGLVNLLLLARAAAAAGADCAPHGGGLLPALHLAAIGEPVSVVELHLLLEPRRSAHLAAPPPTGDPQAAGALPVPVAPGWCGDLRAGLLSG